MGLPPGTQVFKLPHGLLVNHINRYLPKTTMLRAVTEGDAGEQLNGSSPATLALLPGILCSYRGKLPS